MGLTLDTTTVSVFIIRHVDRRTVQQFVFDLFSLLYSTEFYLTYRHKPIL